MTNKEWLQKQFSSKSPHTLTHFAQACGLQGVGLKSKQQVLKELEVLSNLQTRPVTKDNTYTIGLLNYWDRDLQGRIETYTHTAEVEHNQCGDWVTMTAIIEDSVIEKLAFQAGGCCLSECCASFVACNMEGLHVKQALEFDIEGLLTFLKIKIHPDRTPCVSLGLNCLRKLINEET